MADLEPTKDFRIPKPTARRGWGSEPDARVPRDWTVAEIEEAMWRMRAAGATDSTPVAVKDYGDEAGIVAKGIAADLLDLPRRRAQGEPQAPPEPDPGRPFLTPRTALAAAFGAPVALTLLAVLCLLCWHAVKFFA